jgi:hypothetical protein
VAPLRVTRALSGACRRAVIIRSADERERESWQRPAQRRPQVQCAPAAFSALSTPQLQPVARSPEAHEVMDAVLS